VDDRGKVTKRVSLGKRFLLNQVQGGGDKRGWGKIKVQKEETRKPGDQRAWAIGDHQHQPGQHWQTQLGGGQTTFYHGNDEGEKKNNRTLTNIHDNRPTKKRR